MSQSVASRRIAALERHFDELLFDRTSRRATLTPFGRDILPSAKSLVRLAEAMEHDVVRAKLSPLRLAVPDTCTTVDLARLVASAREHDIHLDFKSAAPAERVELARSLEARAALVSVPPGEGAWSVPLGLAGAAEPRADAIYIETLRSCRADRSPRRRIWIQPEDDVPHIRDRVMRIRDAVGLKPTQVVVSAALTTAVAEVLDSTDLLLASQKQADDLGLHWRRIGELQLVRSFDVAAEFRADADRIRTRLWPPVARCLGVPERTQVGG
jgi:DNA-binding transcriptional LysR family regulator